ncbi:MAG TPA: nucleotidyltransferase family protein [Gammaproteobacteria bacterium]|nr:nucleotidyltransferase family protein [Gammaproteobacteria bacterium]
MAYFPLAFNDLSRMKAIVLAAGLGTRMGALTANVPKPLLEVGSEPLIAHQIAKLGRAGVEEIVVNVARHGEKIRAALGDGASWGVRIGYSDEGEVPLETGGGILRALSRLGPGPFLVFNADVMTDFDPAELRLDGAAGSLLLVPNPEHHARGDFALDEQGFVRAAGPKLTYGGVALFTPRLFAGFPPSAQPLKPILDAAVARGTLRGLRYEGRWLDVGTPERLEQARRMFGTPRAGT